MNTEPVEPEAEPEDEPIRTSDLKAVLSLLAAVLVLFTIGFFVGQDHPRPGTTLDKEAAMKLERAETLWETNQELTSENNGLEEQVEYLSGRVDELEALQGPDTEPPVQNFEVGVDRAEVTTVTPLGVPLHIAASYPDYPGHWMAVDRGPDSDVSVTVTFGGKEFRIPVNGTWVRLNYLTEVRYLTKDGFLAYEYKYDKNNDVIEGAPVKVHMYRALETRINPVFMNDLISEPKRGRKL